MTHFAITWSERLFKTLRLEADSGITQNELEQMKAQIRQAMEAGALGISFEMIYTPGIFADTEEMIELCKVVAE